MPLTQAVIMDYLLTWSTPDEPIYANANVPVQFTMTRFDGGTITLVGGDSATLTVTVPDGTTAVVTTFKVSTMGPGVSIDFACLFPFSEGTGRYLFAMSVSHDSQTIIAEKTLYVN